MTQSKRKGRPHLFSWDDIPGKDNERLIGVLKNRFDIKWAENANIEKIDEGKTIRLSFESNFLSLKLNADKTNVRLKIDDIKTYKFSAKTENGRLNIYHIMRKGRPPIFEQKIIDEILDAFPVDGNQIQPKDLREKVGMSSRTLFKYLNYLYKITAIEKESVHPEKGKGVAYRKSKDIDITWDHMIERMRKELINSSSHNMEYNQAFYLSVLIAMIDIRILDSLRQYNKCAISKRDAMFEHDLEALREMLKKLTSLCSKSVGFSDYAYEINIFRIPLLVMDEDNKIEEFNILLDKMKKMKLFNNSSVDK